MSKDKKSRQKEEGGGGCRRFYKRKNVEEGKSTGVNPDPERFMYGGPGSGKLLWIRPDQSEN